MKRVGSAALACFDRRVPCLRRWLITRLGLRFQKIRVDRCARSAGWEKQSTAECLRDTTEPKRPLVSPQATVFIIQASSLHFSEEPQSQDALHGRSAILRCERSGPEDMRYWWTQDGRRVEDSERRFQEGSNLKFTAVDRHADTGNFQCVASSSSTGETVRSANASINIKWLERGPVTMNEPASEVELEEAERIVLQCHIDGHPRPSSKWLKDGAQLDRKDRILTLTSLSPGDSGIYSCCAQNAAGKVCSNHNITLNIMECPSDPRACPSDLEHVQSDPGECPSDLERVRLM
ncbi:inactive tyrosine- kinase 7-like protein [Labeo rohita]|uniref:Inactive tyrosine-kinase 7-like protein n=1 Tax=Labeo rohita TaxID=84645 RepID=A0A498MK85_LABRO|nr:inactive tyrosine- kinase 7-like protein [Labeo rohita]